MNKWTEAYMDVVKRFAELSSARNLKVGAIAVKNNRIISIGYNGMPSGWSNECEYLDESLVESWMSPNDYDLYGCYKTKSEVIHAEANCIGKLAQSNESGEGATMYVTHAPCVECAKQIYTAGILEVYYGEEYRLMDGVEFLHKCGIRVERI